MFGVGVIFVPLLGSNLLELVYFGTLINGFLRKSLENFNE
jgi:hypothetical protein